MDNPFVSIVIPVYNGSKYLKKAIDSALSQTYQNIEAIVVNDGSSDNSEEIALSYGNRIRYFRKENGGVSSALNLGIREMKGQYFSWLSHDDEYSPYKVQNQVEALRKIGDPKMICLCAGRTMDKDSVFYKQKAKKWFREERVYSWPEVLKSLLLRGTFGGCNLLIPKAVFDEVGVFDENLRHAQDSLMWSKIFLHKYSLLFNNDADVYTRVHNEQRTQTDRDVFKKDAVVCAKMLLPMYSELSTRENNFLYYFGYRNAKNNIKEVVEAVISNGKEAHKLSFFMIFKLRIINAYGSIRPMIKRIYYKLVKNVVIK